MVLTQQRVTEVFVFVFLIESMFSGKVISQLVQFSPELTGEDSKDDAKGWACTYP
jgi:hypothetical protein